MVGQNIICPLQLLRDKPGISEYVQAAQKISWVKVQDLLFKNRGQIEAVIVPGGGKVQLVETFPSITKEHKICPWHRTCKLEMRSTYNFGTFEPGSLHTIGCNCNLATRFGNWRSHIETSESVLRFYDACACSGTGMKCFYCWRTYKSAHVLISHGPIHKPEV